MELTKHHNLRLETDKKTRRSRDREFALDPACPASHFLNAHAGGTFNTYERALDAVAKLVGATYYTDIDWSAIRRHHVNAIKNALTEKNKSASTIRLYLAAIKGVAKEAWLLRKLSIDDYQAIEAVKAPKGDKKRVGKALNLADIFTLIDACLPEKPTPIDWRDRAILHVLYGTGLRRFEVANLQLSDIEFGLNEVHVQSGKGDKKRIVPSDDDVFDAILDYVESVRGEWPGPLFTAISKTGTLRHEAMSESSIYYICQKRAKQTKLSDIKPHNFRRTFGTEHDKAGTDLEVISNLLGHAEIETTRTYIHDDKEKKSHEAARKAGLFDRSKISK